MEGSKSETLGKRAGKKVESKEEAAREEGTDLYLCAKHLCEQQLSRFEYLLCSENSGYTYNLEQKSVDSVVRWAACIPWPRCCLASATL